jgi:hypothetical protein
MRDEPDDVPVLEQAAAAAIMKKARAVRKAIASSGER